MLSFPHPSLPTDPPASSILLVQRSVDPYPTRVHTYPVQQVVQDHVSEWADKRVRDSFSYQGAERARKKVNSRVVDALGN